MANLRELLKVGRVGSTTPVGPLALEKRRGAR
jgi:hypothetical protein